MKIHAACLFLALTKGLEFHKVEIIFFSFLTMDGILNGLIEKEQITKERKSEIVEHLAKPFTPKAN